MSLLNLLRKNHGSVMVEAIFAIPILIFLTFATIQIGIIFFTLNSLNYITFEVARSMSVGGSDDETNGSLVPCSDLGDPQSAESIMCDKISVLPGEFSVSASDGEAGGISLAGSPITTQLKLVSSSIIIFDPTDAFDTISMQATSTQIKETTHVD